jgi:hypothetical protein
MTGAKAVFIKSGVTGSVGSAACALWQELASQLTADRTFKVWPFEGELQELLQSTSVVVGEMYPRAAYATALLDAPPTSRGPMVVAKTDAGVRREAIATLRAATWVRSLRVELRDLTDAEHQCSDGKRGGDGAHGISRKDGRAIVCQASPTGKACGPHVAYRASASQAAKCRSSSV